MCVLAVLACKKNGSDATLSLDNIAVTGDAVDVTSTSATLIGIFQPLPSMKIDKTGIYCSKDPDPLNAPCVSWSGRDENRETGVYRFTFTNLAPSTTYYYQAYMHYDWLYKYSRADGEVKSFTTLAAE